MSSADHVNSYRLVHFSPSALPSDLIGLICPATPAPIVSARRDCSDLRRVRLLMSATYRYYLCLTKMTQRNKAPLIVDVRTLGVALDELSSASPTMRLLTGIYGNPPAWKREPGFASLAYAILEQQVSLPSARAVYERLLERVGDLTAANFLLIADAELRSLGFSRQKSECVKTTAALVAGKQLDLESLANEDDETVRRNLIAIKGIGPWTADVYLLHSLGRPDVWPTGDLALRVAVQESLGLDDRPSQAELFVIGEAFRPWRSVAARDATDLISKARRST